MAHGHEASPLVHRLELLSVLFALLSVPMIILQATASEHLRTIGEVGSAIIWLFFVVEVVILLRIAPDNVAWIRGHKIEFSVVILASPVLTLLSEGESAFGLLPFVVAVRFLKFLRFAKIAKLMKLSKIHVIMEKHPLLPKGLSILVSVACGVVGLAILGMLLDHEAHSWTHGLEYWLRNLKSGLRVRTSTLIWTGAVLLAFGYLVRRAMRSDSGREMDLDI